MARKHHFAAYAFLLLMGTALPVIAGPIDVIQAQQNAEQFRHTLMPSNGMRKAVGVTTPMEHVYTYNDADGRPALYVFNTGERGFILASADDAAISILGYSDDGAFDASNLPPGFDDMLQNYAAEISYASSIGKAAGPRKASVLDGELHPTLPVTDYTVQETAPILPLLGELRWGQTSPYNKQCPYALTNADGDAHASTGCVTTAVVQIMKYHQHPKRGYGSNYQDCKQGFTSVPAVLDYYTHTYNWDLMHDYRTSYTKTGNGKGYDPNAQDVQEVAQIMFDVAAALRTEYGNVSSAVYTSIIPALISYFDYDEGMELVQRSKLASQEEWNSIIIEELQNDRPVYLGGFPEGTLSGHAFVCDGYDGKGYFHINWGWDGASNGYYLMTALNPSVQGVGQTGSGYSSKMNMVRGIQPNRKEVKERPYVYCYDYNNDNIGVFRMQDVNTNSIYYSGRFSSKPGWHIRAKLGVRIVHEDGRTETVWSQNGEPVNLLNNNTYYDFRVDIKPEWQHAGTRVYYIYQECGDNEWHYIRNHEGRLYYYRYYLNDKGQLCITVDKSEPGFTPEISEDGIAPIPPVFPLNFPYDASATRTSERAIGTIGMQVEGANPQVYSVDAAKVYRNMTKSAIFSAPAGAVVTPSITYAKGGWMNSYFYIDLDDDGTLSYNANQISQTGTDLVSFSFWTGNEANGESGQNSAGNAVSGNARDNLTLPSFTAPETPGRYNVRFKIDWNSATPAGNPGNNGKNFIIDNGGYIVDAVLIVTDPDSYNNELATAIAFYERAVAAYEALIDEYRNHQKQEVQILLVDLITALGAYVELPQSATVVDYNTAAEVINTKVGETRLTIQKITGTIEPENPDVPGTDVDDDPAMHDAQLKGIYVGFGTSALDLYPAFDPDVHLYLARRSNSQYDALSGSCLLLASNTYTITGTAHDGDAKVSAPIHLRPLSGWNRATITCTAADGKTKQDYHVILIGDGGNATADPKTKPVSATDISLLISMMNPAFGYREANPDDSRWIDTFISTSELNKLVDLLLKK